MNEFAGIYYDGRTSMRHPVVVSLQGDELRVRGADGVSVTCPVGEAAVVPQPGAIRGTIRLPDGGMVETTDRHGVGALLRIQRRGGFFTAVHRWENSLKYVAIALVATAAVMAGAVRFGIPALAKRAAFAIPPSLESTMGRQTLKTLDGLLLKPTRLPVPRQKELQSLFRKMSLRLPYGGEYRLELRRADALGANAFALPSGIIVVTDQLVELARNDNEMAGVLAHEMAHERNRHALRQLLQSSSIALVIATLTGDISSITTLGATLPTALIDAKFSRAFEIEADDGAVAYLKHAGIPPRGYAEFLARLEAEHAAGRGGAGAVPPGARYLASHPDTKERILRVLAEEGKP
jgi:Zn-dependent protease with chaperone function